MYSMRVRSVMERGKRVVALPGTTVAKAAKMMAKKNVGAVMVVEEKHLVGIFTERDVVIRVVAEGRDVATTRIGDVMTPSPITIGPDEVFGRALLLMHDNGFRHLPVVEQGEPIGIVSSRSALDPEMEEFVSETQRRLNLR
ncbi:MAG TPA: CBS domain-containing protein [Usitatibacteraceae bacterium]|nr:CBS domain-containing protein [Usitatibacteraceae bacterium]